MKGNTIIFQFKERSQQNSVDNDNVRYDGRFIIIADNLALKNNHGFYQEIPGDCERAVNVNDHLKMFKTFTN